MWLELNWGNHSDTLRRRPRLWETLMVPVVSLWPDPWSEGETQALCLCGAAVRSIFTGPSLLDLLFLVEFQRSSVRFVVLVVCALQK